VSFIDKANDLEADEEPFSAKHDDAHLRTSTLQRFPDLALFELVLRSEIMECRRGQDFARAKLPARASRR
jgi:hypothetical protein